MGTEKVQHEYGADEIQILEGLEAVRQSKLAATVYNDKEGQAYTMAQLAYAVVTGYGMNNIGFENKKYIYLPYKKVTAGNVTDFIDNIQD